MYNQSKASIMPCSTTRIVFNYVSIGRLPIFDIFKNVNHILNIIIKVCGETKVIQKLIPNRESSSGDSLAVATVKNGGCLRRIRDTHVRNSVVHTIIVEF
jgi:hypothetical protein